MYNLYTIQNSFRLSYSSKLILLSLLFTIFSCTKQQVKTTPQTTAKQRRTIEIEKLKEELVQTESARKDSLALKIYDNYSQNMSKSDGIDFLEKSFDDGQLKNDSVIYLLAVENFNLKNLNRSLRFMKELKFSLKYKELADRYIFQIITQQEKAERFFAQGIKEYDNQEFDRAFQQFRSCNLIQKDHSEAKFYQSLSQARSYLIKGDQASLKISQDILTSLIKERANRGELYYYIALVCSKKHQIDPKLVNDHFEKALKLTTDNTLRTKIMTDYQEFKGKLEK